MNKGMTFLEMVRACGQSIITAEHAEELRKKWLAQYPDIARFFEQAERAEGRAPVAGRGFLDGEGTYRVKLLNRCWKSASYAGDVYAVEFQILESNNERHPVGAIRTYAKRGSAPHNIERAADGAELQVKTRESVRRTGEPFTNYSWTPVVAAQTSEAAVEPIVAFGATCKRCNTFNEHAEARLDFVCFGCRAFHG